MKRLTMLSMVLSLLLVTFVVVVPADAQKKSEAKGKPNKPPAEETLMVALRWTAGGGVRPDILGATGVYVDGEEGARIGFGQSGNLMFTIAPMKGKNKPNSRALTLDFTDLDSLVGDEVRPGFADGPLDRPSTTARGDVTLFVAPDDGAGNPHPDGIAEITVNSGPIPTRLPMFFQDDEGSGWRLTWSQPNYSDRGTGFAALECVQEDSGRCVVWTVYFPDVEPNWGVVMADIRGTNTTGNAVLWNNFDNRPDGGVYTMPFKMAICLTPLIDAVTCSNLAQ